MLSTGEHPFMKLCDEWSVKIADAIEYKEREFNCYARKTSNYFTGKVSLDAAGYDSVPMNNSIFSNAASPEFKMRLNQIFEVVALYGPTLLGQTPNMLINPKRRPVMSPEFAGVDLMDPMMAEQFQMYLQQQQQFASQIESEADILQFYANWTQLENNKIAHGQRAITQAIIAGMGGLYTEWHTPPASQMSYARSRFISQDRVVWDQDARTWDDLTWMAILHVEPKNRVAEKYGIPYREFERHSPEGTFSSNSARALMDSYKADLAGNGHTTHDLVCYWEVFSKNGIGQFLHRTDKVSPENLQKMERVGRFVRMCICPGIPYPLNAPSFQLEQEEAEATIMRFQWPTPFYLDENCGGGWPWTPLYYYEQPNCTYPMSIPRSVLPEIEFCNYVMTKLAQRVIASCDTIIGVNASVVDSVKEQLATQSGVFKLLEISANDEQDLSKFIQFLNTIDANGDVWVMLRQVMDRVDKGMGTPELLYGSSASAFRSAEEARLKGGNISIRPDDMAKKTQTFLSQVAKKEMACAHWHSQAKDLAPVLGPEVAAVMEQTVLLRPPDEFAREFNFEVEAGSTQPLNQQARQKFLMELGQYLLPVATQMIQSGNAQPFNAWITDYAETMNLDVSRYLIQPSPPPPPQEDLKAREMYENHQHRMQIRENEHQQSLAHADEKFQSDLEYEQFLRRLQGKGNGADE